MLQQTLKKWFISVGTFSPARYLLYHGANLARMRFKNMDYILFDLPSEISSLPEPRPWIQRRVMGEPPLSLVELDQAFLKISRDPRPLGVILHMRPLALSLADLQSLRQSISRLRQRGKRVICYSSSYNLGAYFVASAADEVLLQPGGDLTPMGLRAQPVFMKDALDMIGMEIDSVAISPFKSATDSYTRSDISPEAREQLDWLLDSQYDMLREGIADGRQLSPEDVNALIDQTPYTNDEALEKGYVDGCLTADQLPRHLETEHIVMWSKAAKLLKQSKPINHEKAVALLRIEGMIVDGKSEKPPVDIPVPLLGGTRAGDITVVNQVRQILANKNYAAVVVYIDSPGGSAAASEAMASALDELAKDRPVVVYMNGVAASGGYYVATPARWIVAQPGTMTGSIGVIFAKTVNQKTYEKLRLNRIELKRGANADFNSDITPYTEEQRAQVRRSIESIYGVFLDRVAKSRDMTTESVDAIGGGRVWTGQQALENGLVDQLGGLRQALDHARMLAHLPDNAPLVTPQFKKDETLPPRFIKQVNPAASLGYMQRGVKAVFSSRAQMLMPFTIE